MAVVWRLRLGRWTSSAGSLWLAGVLLLLLHFALAFHLRHGWSHAAAVAATAAQTKALTGFDWGGGVWLNYLLAIVWLLDALWLRFHAASHARRPLWQSAAIHGWLAFLWLNATVVFGATPARVFGAAGLAIIAGVRWRGKAAATPAQKT